MDSVACLFGSVGARQVAVVWVLCGVPGGYDGLTAASLPCQLIVLSLVASNVLLSGSV